MQFHWCLRPTPTEEKHRYSVSEVITEASTLDEAWAKVPMPQQPLVWCWWVDTEEPHED